MGAVAVAIGLPDGRAALQRRVNLGLCPEGAACRGASAWACIIHGLGRVCLVAEELDAGSAVGITKIAVGEVDARVYHPHDDPGPIHASGVSEDWGARGGPADVVGRIEEERGLHRIYGSQVSEPAERPQGDAGRHHVANHGLNGHSQAIVACQRAAGFHQDVYIDISCLIPVERQEFIRPSSRGRLASRLLSGQQPC